MERAEEIMQEALDAAEAALGNEIDLILTLDRAIATITHIQTEIESTRKGAA